MKTQASLLGGVFTIPTDIGDLAGDQDGATVSDEQMDLLDRDLDRLRVVLEHRCDQDRVAQEELRVRLGRARARVDRDRAPAGRPVR